MKDFVTTNRTTVLVALAIVLVTVTVSAQSGDNALPALKMAYELTQWTVDGGGGADTVGKYALVGTIGQGDASPVLNSGKYSLAGGFWNGVGPVEEDPPRWLIFYLPLVLQNAP